MHLLRFAPVSGIAFLVLALGLPSSAAAAAPSLVAPAAAAAGGTEGGSMSFEWSGALQGDTDALDRSFFRLEVIKASNMPAGAQAEWPPSTLENSAQTVPGAAENTISLGVPLAGEYRWRVCAWGVVDDEVANEIIQLPGGCSTSRAFTTVAASVTGQGIGELKVEEQTQVEGETRTVYVEREAADAAQETTTAAPAQEVAEEVEEIVETTFTKIAPTTVERGQGSAISGLGGGGSGSGGDSGSGGGGDGADSDDPFASDQAAERKGVGGAVVTGLSSSLPFVPIPFWTLALLLACFPLAIFWRRSVLGMFDWSDGSIDGRGGLDDVLADLAFVPVDPEVKLGSMTADGTAAAPAPIASSTPDRGRRAA